LVDVCAFGHITKESEVFKEVFRTFTAGPPYFFSIALRRLGSNVKVVTKIAASDLDIISELIDLGINVVVRESKHTSSFHTRYGKSLDERYIEVLSIADPFTIDDLKYCSEGKFIYVGPLTTEDFNIEFLIEARKYAPIILDVQGFTRRVVSNRIEYVDWSWKYEGARYIDVFKADIKEAGIITKINDPVEAIDVILEWGPREVMITSNKGAYLGVKGVGKFFSPFRVREIKGRVGRGDTCIASYIHARLKGMDYAKSLIFATAATSLKLSYQGPLRNDETEVLKYIKDNYSDVDPRHLPTK